MDSKHIAKAMTIAGSDSGGGAGIQADLKSFSALEVYGTSVLTAITSQNTLGVFDVFELPITLIESQIEAIISDIGTDSVKTGMLSNPEIIGAVSRKIRQHELNKLVVDPVMVAKGGHRLLQTEAVEALQTSLVPLATVVTPNIPEAEVLTAMRIRNVDDARTAAKILVDDLGAASAVIKGGHLDGPATDVFYDGSLFKLFTTDRIITNNTHGTGCTFASATAAELAKGRPIIESVGIAKQYVTAAIRYSFEIGSGHGPLNHFHKTWDQTDEIIR